MSFPAGFAPAILHFFYRDGEGAVTERFVTFWSSAPHHFTGFCFTAMDGRSFRFDQVVAWIAPDNPLARPQPDLAPTIRQPRRVVRTGRDILFTGFHDDERAQMESLAEQAGYRVRVSVTKGLDYLCCGPNAGPSKMRKAREVGAEFLNADEFAQLITLGELPAQTHRGHLRTG